MAAVFRIGVLRLVTNIAGQPTTAAQKTLLQSKQFLPAVSQSCTITGKSFRGKPLERPKPWPYKTKNYNVFHSLYDKTTWRFDENSKIIVVDGPIAAGKSEFCKALADELEMLYIPEPTLLSKLYTNPYGYDMRKLDDRLPLNCRSFEVKDFLANPNSSRSASFQMTMLFYRYGDYVDALAHLLSTGQGVVLERSVYSDVVFMETMFKHGFVSKDVRKYYHQVLYHVMPELMKPHLVIYLDVPVAEVKNRIKKRNRPHEVNSKALTDEYLSNLESYYKQNYLKDISNHAELLVYDWSNHGEVEVVVEDIERIDFDRFDKHDDKQKDWRFGHEEEWNAKRMLYGSNKQHLMTYFNVPVLNIPELLWTADETYEFNKVWFSAPGMQYRYGYNEDMGDTNLLFKEKVDLRDGK